MADKKLNAEYGYGQLELNQCAFRRDGRIEAQCKIADGIEYLENGMILAINDENLLGNDIINGLNDNVKNIILISLELIDRGAHSAQLITKSIIHVFIGKILGSSAARSVEGKLFNFLNSSHILFTSSLYYASMQRNLTAGQPLGMVALALMTSSTGAPSMPSVGLVADRRI